MDNLISTRSAALLALLMTIVLLSACNFEGVTAPTETATPQPTGTVTPQPAETITPQPTVTPGVGDQGPAPAGGTRAGAGGTAGGVNLGLVVLGGVIVAGGTLLFRRRLQT